MECFWVIGCKGKKYILCSNAWKKSSCVHFVANASCPLTVCCSKSGRGVAHVYQGSGRAIPDAGIPG